MGPWAQNLGPGPKIWAQGQNLGPGLKIWTQGPKFGPRAQNLGPGPKIWAQGPKFGPRAQIRAQGPNLSPGPINWARAQLNLKSLRAPPRLSTDSQIIYPSFIWASRDILPGDPLIICLGIPICEFMYHSQKMFPKQWTQNLGPGPKI